MIVVLFSISYVNASQDNTTSTINSNSPYEETLSDNSSEITNLIINAKNNDEIIIEPGTYCIHNITLTKNITFIGNGDPGDIIIDGEKKDSIFLIRSDAVHVSFKNITFINANVEGFGGAISMETGHVWVDNCIFANNTASVNAGGISNYGTDKYRGELHVNNSLFLNNHGARDGGAITTCNADSYIYNSVFINNSAHRDGGAIRVSVKGYGDVQDCIFMFNHADEWGGAYYSWSGTSNINRCIFLNNTAGTNGGAVMVSGDLNIENSIIMNNKGGETGGSFYIQQPMYDTTTIINVHDNLITNNSSPYGNEIFIKWNDTQHLFTKFNNNDWGDEDPNDPSVIDPDHVTSRSKVTSIIKSNLLNILNLGLLTRYSDLLEDYFPDGYLDNIESNLNNDENNIAEDNANNFFKNENSLITGEKNKLEDIDSPNNLKTDQRNEKIDANSKFNSPVSSESSSNTQISGNSTTHGENDKAYELNKQESIKKQSSLDIKVFIVAIALVFILLAIGYNRYKKE